MSELGVTVAGLDSRQLSLGKGATRVVGVVVEGDEQRPLPPPDAGWDPGRRWVQEELFVGARFQRLALTAGELEAAGR